MYCQEQPEVLLRFIDPEKDNIGQYADSLCFNELSKGALNKKMHVALEICNGATKKGNRCKDKEVIDEWLTKHEIAISLQKTIVKKNAFSDTADKRFKSKDDPSDYFPLEPRISTVYNKKASNANKSETTVLKIFLRVDSINIDDSML